MGEFFGKYIGIVGILALLFAIAYVVAPFTNTVLPAGFTELLSLFVGFYVARNGPKVVSGVRGGP
jgi:hypothetical protein